MRYEILKRKWQLIKPQQQQQQQPEIIKELNEPVIKKRTRGPNKPKIYATAIQQQIKQAILENENAFNVSDPNEPGEIIQNLYKEKGDFIGVNPSIKKGEFINNNTFIQKDLKAQAKLYKDELDKQKKDNIKQNEPEIKPKRKYTKKAEKK